MLQENERCELQRHIEAAIEQAELEIERLSENVAPVKPDVAIGRLTRMEAIQSKSISELGLRKAKGRHKSLQRALKRLIEDEEFGVCDACEDPIPYKRILLVPEATRCVACAEKKRPR